jgi:hypothetical protein
LQAVAKEDAPITIVEPVLAAATPASTRPAQAMGYVDHCASGCCAPSPDVALVPSPGLSRPTTSSGKRRRSGGNGGKKALILPWRWTARPHRCLQRPQPRCRTQQQQQQQQRWRLGQRQVAHCMCAGCMPANRFCGGRRRPRRWASLPPRCRHGDSACACAFLRTRPSWSWCASLCGHRRRLTFPPRWRSAAASTRSTRAWSCALTMWRPRCRGGRPRRWM